MIPAVRIPEGQLIAANGVYDLSMERYHGQPTIKPSFSSGSIRLGWNKSPAHYFAGSDLNPNKVAAGDRPHFSFGRAAHHLIYMGRKGFDEEFVVRPDYYPDYRKAEARAWKAEMLKAGLTIITQEELAHITGMARSLGQHPLVRAGILDGAVERSLIFYDEETRTYVKARPDNITESSANWSDLKTAIDVTDAGIARALKQHSYHVQAGIGAWACREVLKLELESFSFVWAEKLPPYCVRVTEALPEDLAAGEAQAKAMLRVYRRCIDQGVWPGPGGYQTDAHPMGLGERELMRIYDRIELMKQSPDDFGARAEAEPDPTPDDGDAYDD